MLSCLSPTQSHRKVGTLWRESGLSWSDFLPEGEDGQDFISEQVSEINPLYYGMEASQQKQVHSNLTLFISPPLHVLLLSEAPVHRGGLLQP